MKKNNKRGFTLAELLIVVAIIAVLVAVAIPVFTTQLEKSKEATDIANIRSGYAECMAALLVEADDTANGVTFSAATASAPAQAVKSGVAIKQGVSGWISEGDIAGNPYGPTATGTNAIPAVTSANTVTITVKGDGTWSCTTGTTSGGATGG